MSNSILKVNDHPEFKKLKADKKFQSCLVDHGDEIYPNGIFRFNVSKLLKFIDENPADFALESVDVETCYSGLQKHLDEATIASADTSRPLILAEISPGRFNVIDGNHRLERAHRDGLKEVSAYKLKIPFHLKFLISKQGYVAFVDYWNEKITRI